MEIKKLRHVVYCMALLAVTACVEENLENEIPIEAEVTAAIEAPASAIDFQGETTTDESTRTFIDESDAYESGVGTLWRPREVIGVYGSYVTNAKFTGTNTKDAGTVKFSGLILGTPKYAYYPYSSKNNGVSATAVKGSIPSAQDYSQTYRDIVGDYRAGVLDSRSWFSSTFTFKRLVTFLRFTVDATGTEIEGEKIQSISFSVNNNRQLSGDFTINLQTQEATPGKFVEGNNHLLLRWTDTPTLSSGSIYRGYMTALPTMQIGDQMTFVITTDKHVVTIVRNSKVAMKPNGLVNFPLTIKNFSDRVVTEIEQQGPAVAPQLLSMKFTAKDNPGKILTRTITHNTSTGKPVGNENADFAAECTIAEGKVSLYLPYLNNRKLVPTFEIPEGTYLITDRGEEVVSGETEVDFATVKQLTVLNSDGDPAIYDIELTNTGLPVVVVNQKSGNLISSESGDYAKATATWYAATGTKLQPKDADWSMEEGDNFMVYNADGTSALTDNDGNVVEEPIMASTRVRGNVTQQMPKKPFAVKLDKKHGIFMADGDADNDLPAHKRWVLLANWKDRSLIRNEVAFGIADVFKQTFPNDGLAWNPSGQFVELVYNGVYVGNYYLCEQIKIDDKRLKISDPYELPKDGEADTYTGNPADYGYLLECDDAYDETWKFLTKAYIPFLFKDDGNDAMLAYASGLVRGIEDNLYTGSTKTGTTATNAYNAAFANMELTSFVDFLLIQELMMNSELKNPKSCYTYIDGGKLYAGPIWDFDWNTLPESTHFEVSGYSYTKSIINSASVKRSNSYPTSPNTDDAPYMWYPYLMESSEFKALAAERWQAVSGNVAAYAGRIAALEEELRKSEEENWKMWQVDGKSTSDSKKRTALYGLGGSKYYEGWSTCGYCGDEAMTFKQAVDNIASNLQERISGMNGIYK